MRQLIVSACIGLLVLMEVGCGNSSNKANILPPEVQYMADTMFSHRRRALIKEFDSLCIQRQEFLVKSITDSLVLREQESIEKIINREK